MKNRKQVLNYMTKVAVFSALSYLFYYIKFPIPLLFPQFLEIQFSNIPALLGGFVLGPLGGALIVIIRTLFKLIGTTTAGVGELCDLFIGLACVLSSSLFYQKNKTKDGGVYSLVITFFAWIITGCLTNAYITIPFYMDVIGKEAFMNAIVNYTQGLTSENFMSQCIFGIILPFNMFLSFIICFITFIVYKRVSNIFKKDFFR